MARRILVIGIGSGDPDHITVAGVKALNRADAVFLPGKGAEKDGLSALRRAICRRHVSGPGPRLVPFEVPDRDRAPADYDATVLDWHARIALLYSDLIERELGPDGTGALLVWGDPSLYDSTLRVLERVRALGRVAFEIEVVPGVSSVQALAAAHRMPLNSIGGAVHITTGRRLLREGFPENADSAVVMLDGEQAFARIEPHGLDIYWTAYAGSDAEIRIAGALGEVADEILAARAAAREAHGWIMDIYLLRRRARD